MSVRTPRSVVRNATPGNANYIRGILDLVTRPRDDAVSLPPRTRNDLGFTPEAVPTLLSLGRERNRTHTARSRVSAMRIRTARFAMVPMWVVRHPAVFGNGTRIAVYTGLQAVAYEQPDMEWRSTREIAIAVAEVTGLGMEACRKHLSALVVAGAIVKTDTEIRLVLDDPAVGISVGTRSTTSCDAGTQNPDRTTTAQKGTERKHTVGTHGSSADADGVGFEDFWKLYPRRVGKRAATTAWKSALGRARLIQPTEHQARGDMIIAALTARVAWWKRARTPADKIPHAATWLNRDGWLDELEPTPATAAASTAQASADLAVRLRDEVDRAIHDGDAELAWRLTRSRARGRGDQWFDEIARCLDDGRSDRIIVHAVKHDEQNGPFVTVDEIEQVRAAKTALWLACGRGVSLPVGQSPSPVLEGPHEDRS